MTGTMHSCDVAILVLTFKKRLADIKKFLDSVYSSVKYADANGIKANVILLEYGCNTSVLQYAKNLGFHVVSFTMDPGVSIMRNYVIVKYCRKCRYIITLDDDVIMAPDTIVRLIEFMDIYRTDIAQPLVLDPDGSIQSKGFYFNLLGGRAFRVINQSPHPVMYTSACCSIFRLSSLIKIGLFDDNIKIQFDDCEVGLRAWLNRLRVYYVPTTAVIHVGGLTWSRRGTKKDLIKYYYHAAFKVYLLLKLFSGLGLFKVLYFTFIALTLQIVQLIVARRIYEALGIVIGSFQGIRIFIAYKYSSNVHRYMNNSCYTNSINNKIWSIIKQTFINEVKSRLLRKIKVEVR